MMNPLNLTEPNSDQIAEFNEQQETLRSKYQVGNPYSARLEELETLLARLQRQDIRDLAEERKIQTEINDCRRQL